MLPPDRDITCGLPGALSVRVSVPVRVPPAVGLKLTLRLHEPCGAMEALQLLVWLKSPVATMLDMVSGLWPRFSTLKGSGPTVVPMGASMKIRLFPPVKLGMKREGPVIAVPVSPAMWGPAKAVSLIVRIAERVPGSVGAKVTAMVQEAPAPRLAPQVVVKLNWGFAASFEVMPLMLMLVASWFVSVTI